MLGFIKRNTPASDLGTGMFGKIPTAGDFVSIGDYSPASGHLSQWLEEGVGWAVTRAKSDWESLETQGPRAFVFRPEGVEDGERVVVGLLQPSRDAVGRRFPLAIYANLSLGSDIQDYAMLPLAGGEFLEYALGVLAAVGTGQEPRATMRSLVPSIASQLARSKEEFCAWADSTPLASVWAALFGEGETQRASAVIQGLFEVLAPFRGQESLTTPLTLRLPLGGAGVGGAAFWLEVVRCRLARKRRLPCAFWHAYADSGALVIPLGNPSPRTLLELWVSDEKDDAFCDFTATIGALESSTGAMGVSLDESQTVAQFLASL